MFNKRRATLILQKLMLMMPPYKLSLLIQIRIRQVSNPVSFHLLLLPPTSYATVSNLYTTASDTTKQTKTNKKKHQIRREEEEESEKHRKQVRLLIFESREI